MNLNFLIVDKLSNVATRHRRTVTMWFCYHFLMVVLCCTNIIFFIRNWYDLTLCVNDITNILLTIIGFLFAFAGINIYSIFNTNIEAEKERLIEMREMYSQKMSNTLEQLEFSANLTKIQLYGQLIFTSQKNNSQILEWIQKSFDIIQEIENLLRKTYKQDNIEQYYQKKNDIIAVVRGISYLANTFMEKVSKPHSSYFNNTDSKNAIYIQNELKTLQKKLNTLGICTGEDNQNSMRGGYKRNLCNMISKLKTKLGFHSLTCKFSN